MSNPLDDFAVKSMVALEGILNSPSATNSEKSQAASALLVAWIGFKSNLIRELEVAQSHALATSTAQAQLASLQATADKSKLSPGST